MIRIAFASQDGVHVNQHFGWAKQFWLYRVGPDAAELVKVIDSADEPDDEVAKLTYKIGTIGEAQILYCSQIGPKASTMVQAARIYPVRCAEDETIVSAIGKLQGLLTGSTPPWLARIYHTSLQEG